MPPKNQTQRIDELLGGVTEEGQPYTLFMYEWVNPRPQVPLRDVRLVWRAGYSTGVIALLGLTVVAAPGE